ncbi:Sec-independent protein translocase protein TatB [Rhodanobacter sp. BL-MT-08]
MIELSLGKMVLLALIALIVLGPEKLPGAARTAGALLRRVRSGWDNVKAEVERELEIEELKRSAREAVASAEAAQQHVKNTLKETHDPFAEAAAMVKLQPSASKAVSQDAASPEKMTTAGPLAPSPANADAESVVPASPPHLADVSDEHMVADGEPSPEGVQAELPLDKPRPGPEHGPSLHKDAPHDNA